MADEVNSLAVQFHAIGVEQLEPAVHRPSAKRGDHAQHCTNEDLARRCEDFLLCKGFFVSFAFPLGFLMDRFVAD